MILQVENAYKSFGDLSVLKGVSLYMEKGEVISIIGPSGSGKSTLLRCLTFLERINRGTITISGEPVVVQDRSGASVYPDEAVLRKKALKLGLVFQEFNLFPHLSVIENLTLAPDLDISARLAEKKRAFKSKHAEGGRTAFKREAAAFRRIERERSAAEAEALLARVGILDKKDSYPFQLSGGQKQRAAIARALMLNPDILCFDEPTSALDPELTGEVLRVIRDLRSDHRAMIVVTHELSFAKFVSDRIIFMSAGVIEESGSPEDMFENPKSAKTADFINKSLDNFGQQAL